MKKGLLVAAFQLLVACSVRRGSTIPAAPPVNTAEIATADDRAADSLLVDVSSLNRSIIIEMRYSGANNFTGIKLPGYEANRAFMRKAAAAALVRVHVGLASRGLGLKIFDAYRPVRATEEMVRWTRKVNRPDLITDGYIASRSRHNLGVAVDLTLVDRATGRERDMGTAFDTFSAAAHTANATGVVAANRTILRDAMSAAGFSPYSEEWWHFSYNVDDPIRFDRVIR